MLIYKVTLILFLTVYIKTKNISLSHYIIVSNKFHNSEFG